MFRKKIFINLCYKSRILQLLIYTILSLIFLYTSSLAVPPESLRQLIINKKLTGDYITGNIELSETSNISTNFFPPEYKRIKIRTSDNKLYILSRDPKTFGSLIIVKNPHSNKELKRISVGRRVVKITKGNKNNLYVLCTGYFGSIWEIDTTKDIVIQKYTTSWNPTDMVVIKDKIYVTGGYIEIFDIQENDSPPRKIKLPPKYSIKYIEKLFPVSKNFLALKPVYYRNSTNKNINYPQFLYYNINTNKFFPVNNMYSPQINPTAVSLNNKLDSKQYDPKDIIFISNKNFDYISMISINEEKIIGIIPVDAGVDDLLITKDKSLLFVYHYLTGQISIINLKKGGTQYSVIHRIMDPRIRADVIPYQPQLAIEDDKVYLWNKESEEIIVSIDIKKFFTIYDLAFSNVKLQSSKEKVFMSKPANKLFYLKQDQKEIDNFIDSKFCGFSLYAEEISGFNRENTKKKIDIGDKLGGIDMSKDQKYLYITDSFQNKLFIFNTISLKILESFPLGLCPTDIFRIGNNRLFILNSNEGSVTIFDINKKKEKKILPIYLNKFNNVSNQIIKLYDKKMNQIINLHLPFYTNNPSKMIY